VLLHYLSDYQTVRLNSEHKIVILQAAILQGQFRLKLQNSVLQTLWSGKL